MRVRIVHANSVSVHDTANLCLQEVYERASAGQLSWSHYRSCRLRLKKVVAALGPDTLLAAVGQRELSSAVLQFASRPPCGRRPYQKRPHGEPIARWTAMTYIAQMKTLFAWAAEHDLLSWDKPRGFSRAFRLRDRRMRTPQEEERACCGVSTAELDAYSMAELTALFRAGRSLDRLFIVLGLNCGFTSREIASLRTFEVSLEGPHPFIHRRRPKTGVEARWALWPETAALLALHRSPTNVDHRWLLTRAGVHRELALDIRAGRFKPREADLSNYLSQPMNQHRAFEGSHPEGVPEIPGQGAGEEVTIGYVRADLLSRL